MSVNPVGGAGGGHQAANVQGTHVQHQGGGQPPAETQAGRTAADGVNFTDELDEEGGPQGAHDAQDRHPVAQANDPNAADPKRETNEAEDPKAAEERKRKEQEEQLRELDRKINEDNGLLEDAVKKGDQTEATRLQNELGGLLSQRQDLQRQIEGQQQGQGRAPGAVPAAGAGNQLPTGGGQAAPALNAGGQAPQAAPAFNGGGQAPAFNGGGQAGPAFNGGGQAAPAFNGGGGGRAFPPNMMTGGADNPAGVSANDSNPIPPLNLQGDDRRTADFINNYLQEHRSPAAGQQAGELMVQYGRQNNVDPLILLAIAGQETSFGRTGIGSRGMLGVGAYDNDPNNATRNPRFSGVANQIRVGAQTFARLRARGGSNENASVADQASAVNRAGWATDQNWHNGVSRMYAQISRAAQAQG